MRKYKSAILFLFAILFLLPILTGSIYHYVNKRHIPLMILTTITFFTMGVLNLKHSSSNNNDIIHPIALIIFLLPALAYTFSLSDGLKISSMAYSDSLALPTQQHNPVDPFSLDNKTAPPLIDNTIIMDDKTFGKWLPYVYLELDNYIEKNIEISGELWLGNRFPENQFAIGRLIMVCCSADMQAVGLLCEAETFPTLKDGEWITITGVLQKQPYKETFEPVIKVKDIKTTTRPKIPYVNPF